MGQIGLQVDNGEDKLWRKTEWDFWRVVTAAGKTKCARRRRRRPSSVVSREGETATRRDDRGRPLAAAAVIASGSEIYRSIDRSNGRSVANDFIHRAIDVRRAWTAVAVR